MKEEDFKRLQTRALSKAGLVNMSLRKKLIYEEALKINDITNDELELMGWEYNSEMKLLQRVRYVSFNDIKAKFPEEPEEVKEEQPQQIEKVNMGDNVGQMISPFSEQNMNQLQELFNNYETIMKMVDLFKSNKKIDSSDNTIVIELPYEDDKTFKASYRVNKTINKQFKEFCKEHKEFTAKDLLSMALKEYMENHK